MRFTLTGLALLITTLPLAGQLSPGTWRTDLTRHSIDLKELRLGGPGKDGIPALTHPRFVSIADAQRWLDSKEPVIAVQISGEVRAYPLQILIWHEMVDDSISGTPILVSYCPLCNSAVVFDRRIHGTTYDFGVSGMLRNSDMVMFDRQSDSLWQQITGEALVGKFTGEKLSQVPAETVSLEVLAQQFPQAKVLSRDTGYSRDYGTNPYAGYDSSAPMFPLTRPLDRRLPPMERIVVVTAGAKSKAYPFSSLRQTGFAEDSIVSRRFVVFFDEGVRSALDADKIADSREVGTVGVYSPELEGRILTFQRNGAVIFDNQTGSSWSVLGVATRGPLSGKRLAPMEHTVAFAFAWLVFRPETDVVKLQKTTPPTE